MSRAAVGSKSTLAAPPPASAPIPRDHIAMRAYEKWRRRGCQDGTDLQDWFEAEQELQAEFQRRTKSRK